MKIIIKRDSPEEPGEELIKALVLSSLLYGDQFGLWIKENMRELYKQFINSKEA